MYSVFSLELKAETILLLFSFKFPHAGVLCLLSVAFVVLCILRGCRQLREYQRSQAHYRDMNNVLSPVEKRNGTRVGINTGNNDANDDEHCLLAEGSQSSSDEDFGILEPSNGVLTGGAKET